MIENLWKQVSEPAQTRQALIQIKELLRGENGAREREKLMAVFGGDYAELAGLLAHEDAKVRKNASLVMKELAVPEFMPVLWKAYCEENTRFVRSDYLGAISAFDYTELVPELNARLEALSKEEVTEENRKHIQEEKMQLRKLLQDKQESKPHRFKGDGIESEIVLTTNRNHKHIVLDAVNVSAKKEFNAGVILRTAKPSALLDIRTFEEMFFRLPKCHSVSAEPEKAAKELLEGDLAGYVARRHEENGSGFRFRIELRSSMELDKKSAFVRKLAGLLEEKSGGVLENAVAGYEFEIRLIENKDGKYNVLLKFFTLKDFRFAYRRKTVSTGMRPVNAALCIALAAGEKRVVNGKEMPLFKENAYVLDPFCGAGTLLVERAKAVRTKEMFGLDIMEEAITAARENSVAAGVPVNYVHRDFFTFTKDGLFDEIVTDFPFAQEKALVANLSDLYCKFFEKAGEHLTADGIMVLYTHDRELLKRFAAKEYRVVREFEISMKEGSYLFVLQRKIL